MRSVHFYKVQHAVLWCHETMCCSCVHSELTISMEESLELWRHLTIWEETKIIMLKDDDVWWVYTIEYQELHCTSFSNNMYDHKITEFCPIVLIAPNLPTLLLCHWLAALQMHSATPVPVKDGYLFCKAFNTAARLTRCGKNPVVPISTTMDWNLFLLYRNHSTEGQHGLHFAGLNTNDLCGCDVLE